MTDFIIGPDGNVYRSGLPARIPPPSGPVTPNFIAGTNAVHKGGLPIPRPTPGLPVPMANPGNLPALGPQNFTIGPSGPTMTPAQAAAPRLLTHQPIPQGGASVPAAGGPGGLPLKPPGLIRKTLGGAKTVGKPLLGLGIADMAIGAEPDPNEFGIDPGIGDPLPKLMGQGIQSAHDFGADLAAEGREQKGSNRPIGDFLSILAGETMQSPARVAAGAKDIAEDPFGAFLTFGEKGTDVLQGAADYVQEVTPKFEAFQTRDDFARQEREKQMVKQLRKTEAQQDVAVLADAMANEVFNRSEASITEPFTLGNVQFPQAPHLPPPPPAADFSRVYETLAKTMPQDPDTNDFQTQQTIAVLAGMASGLLRMRNGDMGEMLLGAGIGGLAGQATSDVAKANAEAKFKAGLDAYHVRLATVQRADAENDATYARRVWEHNNSNILRRYAQANQKAAMTNQKITQGSDGLQYITEIVDNGDGTGTRTQRIYRPGVDTTTAAGMMKLFQPLVGKDKAETITSQILTAQTPEKAVGLYVVAKAKADGTYPKLLEQLDAAAPDFLKEYGQTGSVLQGVGAGATEKERGELIQDARDAFLIEVIMANPALLGLAGDIVGLQLPAAPVSQGFSTIEELRR